MTRRCLRLITELTIGIRRTGVTWMWVLKLFASHLISILNSIKNYFQTSQDPSSPLGGPPSTTNILALDTTNNVIPTTTVTDIRDGWENEEWGSLEEEPANEELEEKANHDSNHLAASRSNSNSQSHSSSGGVYNNNTMNNISPTKNGSGNGGDILLNSSSNSNSNWDNYGTTWNDDEFEPIDDANGGELKSNLWQLWQLHSWPE